MTTTDNPLAPDDGGRSHLGDLLRARRRQGGLSQRDLAEQISYSRSSVAHAEAGTDLATLPGRQFWQRCDEALGAAGTLVEDYDLVAAGRRPPARGVVAAVAAGAGHDGDAWARGASPGHPTADVAPSGRGEPAEVATAAAPGDGPEALRGDTLRRGLARALPAHSGAPDVDRWEHLAQQYVRSVGVRPPADLRDDVLAVLGDVGSHVGAALRQTDAARTMAVAATLCLVAADTELACGRVAAARRWLRVADRAADSCEEVGLAALASAYEAVSALCSDDEPAAAMRSAETSLLRFERVWCAGTALALAVHAEAAAAAGDRSRARESLAALRGLAGRLPRAAARGPESLLTFRAGRLRHAECAVLAWLGDVPGAEAARDAALAAYDRGQVRARAQVRLSVAIARSRAGDVTGAVDDALGTLDALPAWVADDVLVRAGIARMLATGTASTRTDEADAGVRRLSERLQARRAA